jgi:hypothetical protein
MGLSVLFVTRDHGRSLGRALDSAARVASEVVVADTGSTDETVPLAAARGAKVVRVAWADDFAAALNAGLAACSQDWVLSLNPDEELDPGAADALGEALARPGVFAYRLPVADQLAPDSPALGPPVPELRLFRADPRARFRGRLHPALDPSAEELAAARGQTLAAANVSVRKHAYLSEPTPGKMRWVARLLEAELHDRPGQLHYEIELGRNLVWLNDPRGHEVLGAAAEKVRLTADAPAPPVTTVASLLEYLLAVAPEVRRGPIDRDAARQLAEQWFPQSPPVVWALATERFRAGDHAAAAGYLERLVEMGRVGRYDPAGGRFRPEIIGPAAASNLGLCYLHLGRWDAAKGCFGGLVGHPDYRDDALKGYAQAEQQRRPGATP